MTVYIPTQSASSRYPSACQLGLIGIGLVGSAIARRVIGGGSTVVGFDIDPARQRAFSELGGITVADALGATQCDRLLLSLPDSQTVARTLDLITPSLRRGQIVVDTTTGDPACATANGERLAAAGVKYLDATISGSSAQILEGDVIVMAGGDRAAFDGCEDLFALFARRAMHVGVCGNGSRMKLVTNLVLGLNRAALAEGLSFAATLGLDPAGALTVLRESMAYSSVMETKGRKMVESDFAPEGKLAQHLKDVRLMLDAGAQTGAYMPLTQSHLALLEAAVANGLGTSDNSALIKMFSRPTQDTSATAP